MLNDPMHILAWLCGILVLITYLSSLKSLSKFFDIFPPIVWVYFLPMLSTAFGITPVENPLYKFISWYILPLALFLLTFTTNLKAIAKLGIKPLLIMLGGAVGVVVGCIASFGLFKSFLPAEAWKEFASLSGSWIGGTANLIAIKESVEAKDISHALLMDTFIGYAWMATLLYMVKYQEKFNQYHNADTRVIEEVNAELAKFDEKRRPTETKDVVYILGIGLLITTLAVHLSTLLPALGDPVIINRAMWAVLIVVAIGLGLSISPMRQLEEAGATKLGYFALYILLMKSGVESDISNITMGEMIFFFIAGIVWISIHILFQYLTARLFKAPMFLFAAASMANIGGTVSTPIVTAAYARAMAPVGLLLAIAGNLLGIYAGLFCAWVLSKM